MSPHPSGKEKAAAPPQSKLLAGARPLDPSLAGEGCPYHLLVTRGLASQEDINAGEQKARAGKRDLASILQNEYRVSREDVLKALGDFYGSPLVQFKAGLIPERAALGSLSPAYLKRCGWLPVADDGETVSILIDNPRNAYKNHDIRTLYRGRHIQFYACLREDIVRFIEALVRAEEGARSEVHQISAILDQLTAPGSELQAAPEENEGASALDESDSTVIRLVNRVILDACERGASDIHIEPNSGNTETVIRFRIDGHCRVYQRVPGSYRRAMASRIKILAGLDIAERRLPQDGKIVFRLQDGGKLELRVATIPTSGSGNEDVIMRLLAKGEPVTIDKLNLLPTNFTRFQKILERPYGMILVVGPTGSGKTTTLHSGLKHLNTPSKKVWTAEDPVEITQAGLRQVQVQPKVGLTFAAALRAFLRADPDVVMIGEMRDKETIDIALKAALTGHLVLSTMHTNSAPETVTRLLDMGVDPFTYSDALLGVLAQRLVRTLCLKCREAYVAPRDAYDEFRRAYGEAAFMGLESVREGRLTLYKSAGCEACGMTGYKGRTGIHELLCVDEGIRKAIQARSSALEILQLARERGMTTLMQDGLQKCLTGQTDMRQVLATVSA